MAAKQAGRKSDLKTKPTAGDVGAFVQGLADPKRRADCTVLVDLMQKVTASEPKMWGTTMVGFGDRHYRYASGREGDIFVLGFSPRKDALTLYLSCGVERLQAPLARLGPHRIGKGCLYIRNLAQIDLHVLEEILRQAVANLPTSAGA